MPLTSKPMDELPSRKRIQMTKPFQASNSGLSRPKTPNDPTASGSASASASPDEMSMRDAIASTRRQMVRNAVDSMTDEQLSQVMAMMNPSSAPFRRELNSPLSGPVGDTLGNAGSIPELGLPRKNRDQDIEMAELDAMYAQDNGLPTPSVGLPLPPTGGAEGTSAADLLMQRAQGGGKPTPGYESLYNPEGATSNIPGAIAGMGTLGVPGQPKRTPAVSPVVGGPLGMMNPPGYNSLTHTPQERAAMNDMNPMVDPESDDLSMLNAGGRRFAPDLLYNPEKEQRYAVADAIENAKKRRTLNIPWLNEGNPR